MKALLASVVVAACVLFAQGAEAQVVGASSRAARSSGWGSVTPTDGIVATTYTRDYIPPYSYYAAFPRPARGYVGWGSNDYPFYGKPYGHAYDAWTWTYMISDPYRGLARYYYPPVR
jgi:hypothetical protein